MGKGFRPPRQCPHCFCRNLRRVAVRHEAVRRGRLVRTGEVRAAVCVQCGTRWLDPAGVARLSRPRRGR